MPLLYRKWMPFTAVGMRCLMEVFTALSTSHQNCTMFGLEERQVSTRGWSSSSDSPISSAPIDAVFLHRDVEHLACAGAVDVLPFRKYFGAPGLMRQIGQDTGFNGGIVADNEFVSPAGDERRSDEL